MAETDTLSHANAFLRRMRNARLRQMTTALVSISVATIFVAFLTPDAVGGFAFYTITLLLLINAATSLIQFQRVIRPVTNLLQRLQVLSENLDRNGNAPLEHLACETEDAFSCLAAGFDDVMGRMNERLHRAEIELKQQKELFAGIPLAMVVVSRTGKIFQLVKEQEGVSIPAGLKAGETPSEDVWGSANIAAFNRALVNTFEKNESQWFDFKAASTELPGRHFRAALKRINEFSALMTLADVTDIERRFSLHAENSRNHEATIKRAAMRHMAATLAHDAKNVFGALKNLVDINRTSSDAEVVERIPIAEDAIARGNHLMEELANFAGEARLHVKCRPAEEALKPLIESPTVRALLPKNIELFTSVSEGLCEIDIDVDQVWKIILNLTKNAVEAIKGNTGRIWIKAKPCLMTEEFAHDFRHTTTLPKGRGVLIEVTDDGPGMSEALLDHLFDPYVSSKGPGRGLGLATALTIADAHGGAICVKSSPGYGTSFYIFFPASRNTPEELRLVREAAPNGEILLVDDDPTILHTTSLVLRTLKIAAHPASSEGDALAKVRALRERLRAVLVDANLGAISSAGLVRAIHEELPELPVIVVSGASEDAVAQQFGGIGYARFLSKPYSITELSNTLEKIAPLK